MDYMEVTHYALTKVLFLLVYQPLCSNKEILVIRYCRKVSTVIHWCCWERIWDLLFGMMLMVHLLRNLDI